MLLAFVASLAFANAELPADVREARQAWRACILAGANRRGQTVRGGDFYYLANAVVAGCRLAQDAELAARTRWADALGLDPAQREAALVQHQRDVSTMHNLAVMRARHTAAAYERAAQRSYAPFRPPYAGR